MHERGEGAVFRQIPETIPRFEDLGLPPVLRTLAQAEKGLVLVTGPTGSGKSTTLAAMIDLINETMAGHILTLEDPIEFVHKSKKALVNQREVGSQTRSFTAALRSALREDPDVILVGELRDLETISLALTAPRPVTSCSAPCTRRARPRPSIGSSTCSPPSSRRRCAPCSPSRSWAWSRRCS